MPAIISEHNQFIHGEYHIKLKLNGNRNKISLFNSILYDADRDWPLGRKTPPKICEECGGMIYHAARFLPHHLAGLAKQISLTEAIAGKLKLRVRLFTSKTLCDKNRQDQIKALGTAVPPVVHVNLTQRTPLHPPLLTKAEADALVKKGD